MRLISVAAYYGSEALARTRQSPRHRCEHHARSFIETAGDDIAIADVVADYAKAALAFHAWFWDALAARHNDELQLLDQRQAEFAELWRGAMGDTGTAGVLRPAEE